MVYLFALLNGLPRSSLKGLPRSSLNGLPRSALNGLPRMRARTRVDKYLACVHMKETKCKKENARRE